MSSNKEKYPNDGLSAYSDIRLAYYIYTWDSEGKLKQKTAWSSIGSYSLNDNNDIVYNSNKNQLLKTNGSNGVSVVGNDFGVIVNDGKDVGPTILKLNGTYIAGLDNISNSTLHQTLSTVDPHYILSKGINDFEIKYTDMWSNSSSFSVNIVTTDGHPGIFYLPFLSYSAHTIIEPVELAVIGKESNGINSITNKGFIYNNITYQRNVSIINYYTDLWNYVKDWKYGSNTLSVASYGEMNMEFTLKENNDNKFITTVSDFDITVITSFARRFEQLYNNHSNINDINYNNNVKALSSTCSTLLSIVSSINDLMHNNDPNGIPSLIETPITVNIINSAATALNYWSSSKALTGNLWEDQTTATVIEKLPVNSTFIDFSDHTNATSIIGMNNKTKQWVELKLPTVDQSYDIILRNVISGIGLDPSGSLPLTSLDKFINQYSIIFSNHGSVNSNTSMIKHLINNNGDSKSSSFSSIKLIDYEYDSDNKKITSMKYTSYSYFLLDNNLNNSPSTYRFIGIESEGGWYSNDQGSNSIKITGFNKILLNDLYENPNTYQNATITYYYQDGTTNKSTSNIIEITGNIQSYTVSLSSAIKRDQNVLIGGCGSDDNGHTIGAPGVFYIPLPSEIDMDDNSAYVDTHWMLTTWTPNISNGALSRGIINNQDVLYKYTKMNDLITTGLYGGFTPYYNPNNNITAGVLRIPQISYGTGNYGTPVYVTSCENQIAKLNKIMYSTGNVTLPNNGKIVFYDNNTSTQITNSGDSSTPIGNIAPNTQNDTSFKTYFDSYKQFAACVFTLNSNEKNIIIQNNLMGNNEIGNVAYLDLIGYPDEEFDNLSFDIDRKYIFTFNAHIQVTNLSLMSDQINYGTPSLLLIGHFRNRYCKSNNPLSGSNIVYSGRNIFIPLLNKPLENPVNNIYNVEGTYTLSWNTTGDSINEFNDITKYEMYIPKEAKSYKVANGGETLQAINTKLFKDSAITNTAQIGEGEIIHFENVLDRIYAFILTGETVNNNFMYQFVNNTTYNNGSNRILSNEDINLITGKINGNTAFTITSNYNSTDKEINIIITSASNNIIITCKLTDNKFVNNKITVDKSDTTTLVANVNTDGNFVTISLFNNGDKSSPFNGFIINAKLIQNGEDDISVETYDNHLAFDSTTGIDSGILGINEPMLSMTIQRY